MKSHLLIIFIALNIILQDYVNAQEKVKLNFKKIEIAFYETKNNNNVIEFSNYAQIDELGQVKVCHNGKHDIKFYSYQLSEKLIIELNSLLIEKKTLKKNLVKTKMGNGYHYAGYYNYISFESEKDAESMCFIKSFVSKEFNKVIIQLEDIILAGTQESETINPKFNIEDIKKRILIEHKKSKYLPKIEYPHSMKN